jgi:hypothetical protein
MRMFRTMMMPALAVTLIAANCTHADADCPGDPQCQGLVGEGGGVPRVVIINNNSQDIKFRLRPEGESWEEYQLDPNENAQIPCSRCEIAIKTGDVIKNYYITEQNRYSVEWDNRGFWDIKLVR